MPLKYQHEIDNFNLNFQCPQKVVSLDESQYAYRFSFNPITDKLNFLPNVVFDRLKPILFNYLTAKPETKCRRCGSSFYLNISLALNNYNSLSEQIRNNLGYTHIAYGLLEPGDGFVTEPDGKSHFGFYENEGINLTKNFNLHSEL